MISKHVNQRFSIVVCAPSSVLLPREKMDIQFEFTQKLSEQRWDISVVGTISGGTMQLQRAAAAARSSPCR